MVISPISHKDDTSLVKEFSFESIATLYKKAMNLDISYLAQPGSKIYLYKCNRSGYSFYLPAEMAGDGRFYEELSKQAWYYSRTRWEHQKALELVPSTGSLLEMGCGSGFFLQLLKEAKPNLRSIGLEINEKAITEGAANGLNIINSDIISYAKEHGEEFDFVCSFQVMEHIYSVREVLEAQIALLKKGGQLLIAVPNNDSYMAYNKHVSRCLNMPPHHMGLWDKEVFSYIEKEFGIRKTAIHESPFTEDDYLTYHYNHILRIFKVPALVKVYFKLKFPGLFKNFFMKRYKKKEVGHTILAVFQK